ncbi:MAG: Uma2 family endonuclease [Planctomycetaceae bacterium]|nr:Uma2 family endonuclease [Planctomycetaceae bacterium]
MPPAAFAVRVPSGPPRNLLWTVDQFHALGDMGCFEGRRAWLINGVIIEEGPMNPPHRIALELTDNVLRGIFGLGWRVCVQMPLDVGQNTDPQPDIAIVQGSPRSSSVHPTTAALVVEVSDSSLRYDITSKAELYATAGIADYWVLDVDGRQLWVFRDPAPIPGGGAAYRSQAAFGPTESVAPLAAPTSPVRIADLLP